MLVSSVNCAVLLACFFICTCLGGKVLRQAHVLYRHGDRSPVHLFPTDKYASYWPDGLGRLTQKGMQMEFELGKFLRSRYVENNFLNRSYLHKEVYCRSSDSERCLMSAETQLAGLYPPTGWQVWNKNITWQPVPVHTVPGDQDQYLRPWDFKCPRLKELISEKLKSKEYIEMTKKNQELFSYLEKKSGLKSVGIDNLWAISDTLFVEKCHGLKMPDWYTDKIWSQIVSISLWDFKFKFTGNDEFSRLSGGSLIKLIQGGMERMSLSKSDAFKLNIYSAHDTTIIALLGSMGLYNGTDIPYATAVMIELYEVKPGNFHVEIYLRNSTATSPYQLNLKGCAAECPIASFTNLLQHRIPSDLNKECGNERKTEVKEGRNNMYLVIGLSIVSGLLLIVLAAVLIQQCFAKSAKDNEYLQGADNDDGSTENLLV